MTPAAMHATGPAILCRTSNPLPAGATVPDPGRGT
jgi:hypothetical protein